MRVHLLLVQIIPANGIVRAHLQQESLQVDRIAIFISQLSLYLLLQLQLFDAARAGAVHGETQVKCELFTLHFEILLILSH